MINFEQAPKKLVNSKIHFIGIGGIGMCGIARILHSMGATVTGSDIGRNSQVEILEKLGIEVSIGHQDKNIRDQDVVVYSNAISSKNIEWKTALDKSIPVIHRAEALAELMRLKRGIAIAGTHGKTTTTSLLASILLKSIYKPTVIVGGVLEQIAGTSYLGKNDWLLAEADESDGSFSLLNPEIAVVTNIDKDHLDFYRDFESIKSAFKNFALRIPFYGFLVVCGDDENVKQVFQEFPKKVYFYGSCEKNDYSFKESQGDLKVFFNKEIIANISLSLFGHHNKLNALAAFVVAHQMGVNIEQIISGLEEFSGVGRRMQSINKKLLSERKIEKKDGALFYDDYAHHPTEIHCATQAIVEKYPSKKITVIFQPHRFTRTKDSWSEFINCFNSEINSIFILDIYPAGEKSIEGITSSALVAAINKSNVKYLKTQDLKNVILEQADEDVVMSLGAGNIGKLVTNILLEL